MTLPNKPGLWLRHPPGRHPSVHRVHSDVRLYDGPQVSTGWFDDESDAWKSTEPQDHWVCEIFPDDVPLEAVVVAIQKAISNARNKTCL